jgi:hypothetical protein
MMQSYYYYYYLFATSLCLKSLTSNIFFARALSLPNSGFGGNNNHGSNSNNMAILSDRFRCSCPATLSSIRLFEPSLVLVASSSFSSLQDDENNDNNNENDNNNDSAIWAAVYRSNQNQPSVFIRDDFLNAMKAAVEPVSSSSSSSSSSQPSSVLLETPESKQVPVAVACLRPSVDLDGCYVLDTLRCVLKKENMDASCDGGSEHCEAIAVAIDALLQHHLSSKGSTSSLKNDDKAVRFERAIRAKATLISGNLLEMRGFEPMDELSRDMATHVSSLDACLEKYAERSVNNKISPGAQQRALSIVSCLARLDREADFKAAAAAKAAKARQDQEKGQDDYDPFSSITRFF